MEKGTLTRYGLSAGLALFGVAVLLAPYMLLARAFPLSLDPAGNIWLVRGLAVAFIALGAAILAEPGDRVGPRSRWTGWLILAPVAYFLTLTPHLSAWWIDDAGITFAYARSLAESHGLVAQPGLAPEEGYSSTLWMLILAGAATLGADIPTAAKVLGTLFSAACVALTGHMVLRITHSPLAAVFAGIALASGPTVVWAVSGQEHALQAFLILAAVWAAGRGGAWRWPVAVILAALVLTRPEAPLIVIGVFLAALWLTRQTGRWIILPDLAVAAIPFAAFVALMAFRVSYFGDPMPNPFYAKTASSSLTGLLNPLGGGWRYVFEGLRDSGLIVLLPLVFLARLARFNPVFAVGLAALAAHTVFVVWAKGDWMGQYRFLMPLLPVGILLAALGHPRIGPYRTRVVLSVLAAVFLVRTTVAELHGFKADPTTPLSVVTQIGEGFADLGRRLGIQDPVLAHHDAGGITYERPIRLVDLGGLVDRQIAKHMDDRDFLTQYLLTDIRPDFFFGARNFAALSGFADGEDFARDYVRIEFVDAPLMTSWLTHVRRDRARVAPGIEPITRDGELVLLRVLPSP